MRCIATLQRPTSGSIRFGDIDVIKNPEKLREHLVYLPQEFGFYPRTSAYTMLDHLAVLKGISAPKDRKDTVESLLNQVNLWSVRNQALTGFSGGMRQRFGIAQALIGNPKLIIVDEPTAGLDPEERNRFLNLLAGISNDVVVILSTHIVEDVTALCPRVTILTNGQIKLLGAPAELIGSLRGRIWRKHIDRAELDDYKLRYTIISQRLLAGQVIVHIVSDEDPQNGFESFPGGLEDVYFVTVNSTNKAA
jgi:ABC-type multidrug transport system ATPase subunit